MDNLENAIPGSDVLRPDDSNDNFQINKLCDQVQKPMRNIMKINKSQKGVYAQASTLGSLEVLIKFLQEIDIPINGTSIGPVYKKDVICAISMLDKAPEYSVILAFDVSISAEARELADKNQIKIFRSDIIYELKMLFENYLENLKKEKYKNHSNNLVFPVLLDILDQYIINRKNPIILGMKVKKGILRIGTPLIALQNSGEYIDIGYVSSIQNQGITVKEALSGEKVSVKIESSPQSDIIIEYNRHFTSKNIIVSKITRKSIDILKEYNKKNPLDIDINLLKKLKNILKII